jgi:type IV pilus assembly protein PilN
MIRINLLPFRSTRRKENTRRQLSIFLLSLILVAVGLFGANLLFGIRIDDKKEKITAATAELEKYEKINREIEEIKAKLASLETKMSIIRDLETSRYDPVRLLETLTKVVIDKRMWFTHLETKVESVTQPETKLETRTETFNVNGIAMDDKTVADFMVLLEGCGLFSRVNLKTLKQVEIQKTNLKSFEIVCLKKSTNKPESAASASAGVKN